jgi:tRNA(adenine34) deaminase
LIGINQSWHFCRLGVTLLAKMFVANNDNPILMRLALEQAALALPYDVPVGAVIVDAQGQLIATGYNTRERDQNPLGHAELNAIAQAGQQLGSWRLSGCTLVVTLEPCPMCASAIAQARLARVVYGAADPLYGGAGSRWQLLHQPAPVAIVPGILAVECQQQLHAFFKERR